MPAPYYQLLGHVVAASFALEKSAELSQLLAKGGFDKARQQKASQLAEEGQKWVEKRVEQHDDRIKGHGVHVAVTEVEMWMQTVRFLLKGLEDEVRDTAMGKHLHVHDHAATVAAQANRLIGMIRTDERISSEIGSDRALHDVATRGWSLLKKMYKTCELRLEQDGHEDSAVFEQLEIHHREMEEWMAGLDAACSAVAEKNPQLLGILGYVPEGVGLPVGGTSFAVTLHERSHRDAPDPNDVGPASGWSIGRQSGRNNENLGKGWIDPTLQ